MTDRVFTCDGCGGVFFSDWPEEEALAEYVAMFPGAKPEDRATVCEDCFSLLMGPTP